MFNLSKSDFLRDHLLRKQISFSYKLNYCSFFKKKKIRDIRFLSIQSFNESQNLLQTEYSLNNYHRSNQDTCLLHKPAVFQGQWVESGDLLADCSSSLGGELSLGQNILIAYLPWEGYNFEDAILVSERLVYDDLYTSIHIERYDLEIRETKFGFEEITREIPDVSNDSIKHLHSSGIAKIGSWVEEGNILVGKVTPVSKKNQSNYQKLLYTILDKSILPVRDTSFRAPKGIKAKIIGIQLFKNHKYSQNIFSQTVKKKKITLDQKILLNLKKLYSINLKQLRYKNKESFFQLKIKMNKQPKKMSIKPLIESNNIDFSIVLKNREENKSHNFFNSYNFLKSFNFYSEKEKKILNKIKIFSSISIPPKKFNNSKNKGLGLNSFHSLFFEKIPNPFKNNKLPLYLNKKNLPDLINTSQISLKKANLINNKNKSEEKLLNKDFLKDISLIQIYLAEKRRTQVGDKMAGRHGNKGIISQILPIEDMPFLPDGTPLDMVLNPLGVPSRMNVGQIYECLLGLAGKYLGENYKIIPFDEIYGPEASRSFVYSKLNQARIKLGKNWLFNPQSPGKLRLYDGRTGNSFNQTITVGYAYMLRLVHMVDDKIHARSTGPYSLVTQQPLRGRSKVGGQRLGEMEVWALEGYGAAFTLLEMLTIKSDDMANRMTLWSNLILNKELSMGTPESFKVLICELQALCLDIGLFPLSKKK